MMNDMTTDLTKVILTKFDVDSRRNYIYNQVLTNISNLTINHLYQIVMLYDSYFLLNLINTKLNTNTISLSTKFDNSSKNAGTCSRTNGKSKIDYVITISKTLISQVNDTETNCGLQCNDQLQCLLLTLEHELIHLIIFLYYYHNIIYIDSNGKKRHKHHGELFQSLAHNLFSHTDFTHSIGRGLTEDPELYKAKVLAYIKTWYDS